MSRLGVPLNYPSSLQRVRLGETRPSNPSHRLEQLHDPPPSYTIYLAVDPHPQTPHHVLLLAVAPTGEVFLFDEILCPHALLKIWLLN